MTAVLSVDIGLSIGQFCLSSKFDLGAEIAVLFGESGCGKTTLLNTIAGLNTPQQGSISFDNNLWFDSATKIREAPQKRNLGYVFQGASLFPHLTVAQNIMYGISKWTKDKRQERLIELAHVFQLQPLLDRRPAELSGGQAQRTTLARALAHRPRLLLLDEPFNGLDDKMRELIAEELLSLQSELGLTVLLVTHSWQEAKLLAKTVIRFSAGKTYIDGADKS